MLRQLDWALVLRLDASNRFAVTFSIIVGVLDREDFDDNDWRLLSSWPLKAWMDVFNDGVWRVGAAIQCWRRLFAWRYFLDFGDWELSFSSCGLMITTGVFLRSNA